MVVIRWYSNEYVYFCVYTELALGQWKEESWWTTGWSWISTGWKRATNFHPIQQGARCFLVPRCSRTFQVMMSFPMLDTFRYHPDSTHKHHPKNIQEPSITRCFFWGIYMSWGPKNRVSSWHRDFVDLTTSHDPTSQVNDRLMWEKQCHLHHPPSHHHVYRWYVYIWHMFTISLSAWFMALFYHVLPTLLNLGILVALTN